MWLKLTIRTPERRYFTPCSSIFIANFEQVNADWVDVNRFRSTGRVLFFFCKSQDYLVSCPTGKF